MPRIILLLCLAVTLAACNQTKPAAKSEPPTTITVRSTAFDDGQPIPKQFTGDGQDVSPPLAWENVPDGTKELALICDVPDAPSREPWVHWVIYKIPATGRELPEAMPTDATLEKPVKAVQGKNSWTDGRTVGYRGPAPPPGRVHHYHFKLYAVDRELELDSGMDKGALIKAMAGCILAEGALVGTLHFTWRECLAEQEELGMKLKINATGLSVVPFQDGVSEGDDKSCLDITLFFAGSPYSESQLNRMLDEVLITLRFQWLSKSGRLWSINAQPLLNAHEQLRNLPWFKGRIVTAYETEFGLLHGSMGNYRGGSNSRRTMTYSPSSRGHEGGRQFRRDAYENLVRLNKRRELSYCYGGGSVAW